MNEAPYKITAWVNRDGANEFEAGNLFPKGVEVEYVHKRVFDKLSKALVEITSCVEDGCYCSEMRMAAAIDEANDAIKIMEAGQ